MSPATLEVAAHPTHCFAFSGFAGGAGAHASLFMSPASSILTAHPTRYFAFFVFCSFFALLAFLGYAAGAGASASLCASPASSNTTAHPIHCFSLYVSLLILLTALPFGVLLTAQAPAHGVGRGRAAAETCARGRIEVPCAHHHWPGALRVCAARTVGRVVVDGRDGSS
eukprot:scaffold92464_cov21-Tisochrysis_lutea.AAC.1